MKRVFVALMCLGLLMFIAASMGVLIEDKLPDDTGRFIVLGYLVMAVLCLVALIKSYYENESLEEHNDELAKWIDNELRNRNRERS